MAAGLALVALPANAAESSDSEGGSDERHALIDGLPASDDLTTDSLSTGVVTSPEGRPVPGAAVVVFAWPSAEVESATAVGETISLEPVAQDVTDGAGRYDVRLDSVQRLNRSASKGGIVNFEVRVFSEEGLASYHFPRIVKNRSGKASLHMLEQGRGGENLPAVAEELELQTDESALAPRDGTVDTAVDKHDCSASGGTKVVGYGQRWVTVGATHSATTGVSHDFVYTEGANSSLGVGVSASGKYGSFSSKGTIGRGSTAEIAFAAGGNNIGRSYRTTYDYNQWKVTCGSYFYGTQHSEYQVRAGTFGAGRDIVSVTIPSTSSSYCAPQRVTGTVTVASSSAITWSNGAKLGSNIGMDLSAQTGYTSNAKVTFTFNSVPRRLCGTHGLPGGTPRQLVARNA
ncbi:hypothetical protein [Aquipuribacter nitratireducens]